MGWVVLRPDCSVSEEEIREFCQEKIARYKIHHYIKFTDGFPMTVTGKVQKFKMREIAVEELELRMVVSNGSS